MTPRRDARPTLRDLVREAGGSVPVMLAVTILVQVLGALDKRRRRGLPCTELSLDLVHLAGAPIDALLTDPSRDPQVRIVMPEVPSHGATATRLHGVDALFRYLLVGERPDPRSAAPAVAEPLLSRLTDRRLSLDQALAEARELGLRLLAAWDHERSDAGDGSRGEGDDAGPAEAEVRAVMQEIGGEVEARQALVAAVYAAQRREIIRCGCQLSHLLGEDAAGDRDLDLARDWLAEQAELRARQRFKLFLTGAPLVLATLLTGLLSIVLLLSA